MSRGKILFQLSGSIACFKACSVISRLVQEDFEVEVVATRSALEFVGRATLEGLTGRRTHVEMFETGQYMNHIDLMKWADLVILCPATANTISKLASGAGDDLVSTLFLAYDFKKPYLIAPAMNVNMYDHPATREALSKLEGWGVRVFGTDSGKLACGDVGEGRLLDPEKIHSEIVQALESEKELSGQQILVTSGGTREPLDGVRFLTNMSSGKTGAKLADELSKAGASVTYLHAEGAALPSNNGIRSVSFSSFASLERALKIELGSKDYSAVVHAAAVGDYSVETIETTTGEVQAGATGKLDSAGAINLRLKRNPKLIANIKDWSLNRNIKVIGFKLTNSPNETDGKRAVTRLLSESSPDWVVQNDLSEIKDGHHPFRIYRESALNGPIANVDGAKELSFFLRDILSQGGHA